MCSLTPHEFARSLQPRQSAGSRTTDKFFVVARTYNINEHSCFLHVYIVFLGGMCVEFGDVFVVVLFLWPWHECQLIHAWQALCSVFAQESVRKRSWYIIYHVSSSCVLVSNEWIQDTEWSSGRKRIDNLFNECECVFFK